MPISQPIFLVTAFGALLLSLPAYSQQHGMPTPKPFPHPAQDTAKQTALPLRYSELAKAHGVHLPGIHPTPRMGKNPAEVPPEIVDKK